MRFRIVCRQVMMVLLLTTSTSRAQNVIRIQTNEPSLDAAIDLAIHTLRRNVSEKWGVICPVLAPAWGQCYPAWIHPFDNFWMNKVTVHVFDKKAVAWPIQLFARYQYPTGMIGWGVHDCPSPEAVQAAFAKMTPEQLREASLVSRYIRDHLFVMQVHDLWMATGDESLLRELLPHCTRALEYLFTLKDSDNDGLVESADIIEDIDVAKDGKPGGPNDAERFVDQCLVYGALLDYATMNEAIGDQAEVEKVRNRAARIKELSNNLFWNDRGYYVFAIDTREHTRLHETHTSTYANGYAMLFGLADDERIEKILDYMESWSFEVPGPILIPPLPDNFAHGGNTMSFAPGVYANGGCGWGRGYLPSVTIAHFDRGHLDVGTRHLLGMSEAANKACAFYEYWTWEKYAGKTEPGGCKDYSETASAFLDAVIHGLFGIRSLAPGFSKVRIAPRVPHEWDKAAINLPIPDGSVVGYEYEHSGNIVKVVLNTNVERRFDVSVCTWDRSPASVLVNGLETKFELRQHKRLSTCDVALSAGGVTTVQVGLGPSPTNDG